MKPYDSTSTGLYRRPLDNPLTPSGSTVGVMRDSSIRIDKAGFVKALRRIKWGVLYWQAPGSHNGGNTAVGVMEPKKITWLDKSPNDSPDTAEIERWSEGGIRIDSPGGLLGEFPLKWWLDHATTFSLDLDDNAVRIDVEHGGDKGSFEVVPALGGALALNREFNQWAKKLAGKV